MSSVNKEPSKVFPQYLAATVANLATVAAGCALGWASPAIPKVQREDRTVTTYNECWAWLTEDETSWISSLAPAGAIIGPLLAGFMTDKIGRKWTLMSTALPCFISWVILIIVKFVVPINDSTPDVVPIDVARFIGGIGLGMVFAVVPMYVGEISEKHIRGALGSLLQLLIVFGYLMEYCIGPYVNFEVLASISAVVPLLFAISFFFCPDSPYYLLAKGKREEATKALQWFRGQTKNGVLEELDTIQAAVDEEMKNKAKLSDLIATKGNRKALYLSLSLVAAQQLCGINAVLFNSQAIFENSSGNQGTTYSTFENCSSKDYVPEKNPTAAEYTIIIGIVMFLASGITPFVVDRLGRKMLLMISASGMIVSLVVLGVYFLLMHNNPDDVSDLGWLPITCLVIYIIVYSIGFGPLPWAVMGELFPANVKSYASALTASFCWFIGFFVTKFYSNMARDPGEGIGTYGTFWLFAGCTVVSGVFIFFQLPETKGKSLQEIQEILNK